MSDKFIIFPLLFIISFELLLIVTSNSLVNYSKA